MLITPKRLADAKEAHAALAEFIAEAEAQQPAPEPEWPQTDYYYFRVNLDGTVSNACYGESDLDLACLARGNVHRTEADARAWDAENCLLAAIEKDAAADRAKHTYICGTHEIYVSGTHRPVRRVTFPTLGASRFHTREAAEASAKRHGVGVET